MKKLLTTLTLLGSLLTPLAAAAYFPTQFATPIWTVPQYVQDPSLDLLPGWPSWIGRLNAFSSFFFGRRFETLTTEQKEYIKSLSKEWPEWIGVPGYLSR